ncbi:MAG TPA: hypothetical protein VIT91_03640 [Chthoniobacterales bacterium]
MNNPDHAIQKRRSVHRQSCPTCFQILPSENAPSRWDMKPSIAKPDWDRVHQAACDIVNAYTMGDEILGQSKRERLFDVLDELEEKYGEHPSIIATRGDFSENRDEAMACFQKALKLARFYGDKEEEAGILDSIENLEL